MINVWLIAIIVVLTAMLGVLVLVVLPVQASTIDTLVKENAKLRIMIKWANGDDLAG